MRLIGRPVCTEFYTVLGIEFNKGRRQGSSAGQGPAGWHRALASLGREGGREVFVTRCYGSPFRGREGPAELMHRHLGGQVHRGGQVHPGGHTWPGRGGLCSGEGARKL